jgi:hypothetical protein
MCQDRQEQQVELSTNASLRLRLHDFNRSRRGLAKDSQKRGMRSVYRRGEVQGALVYQLGGISRSAERGMMAEQAELPRID